MAALLDVNVLVALAFRTHVHHERALAWWRAHAAEGWATTPITEVGFVRVCSNSRALPDARTPAEAIGLLERMRTRRGHAFWGDDVTITGEGAVDRVRLASHRCVTDAHLIALARRHGGTVLSFDRGLERLVAPAERGLVTLVG
jgi:uncharacterized protein